MYSFISGLKISYNSGDSVTLRLENEWIILKLYSIITGTGSLAWYMAYGYL